MGVDDDVPPVAYNSAYGVFIDVPPDAGVRDDAPSSFFPNAGILWPPIDVIQIEAIRSASSYSLESSVVFLPDQCAQYMTDVPQACCIGAARRDDVPRGDIEPSYVSSVDFLPWRYTSCLFRPSECFPIRHPLLAYPVGCFS